MLRLLPAIEPAFEIHMPPNAGTSDPNSGRMFMRQGFPVQAPAAERRAHEF